MGNTHSVDGFDKAAKLANYLKIEQIMRKVAT